MKPKPKSLIIPTLDRRGPIRVRSTIDEFIAHIGVIIDHFDQQDSGNLAWGIEQDDGSRVFIKYSGNTEGMALLKSAGQMASTFKHDLLPRFRGSFELDSGYALCYDWVDGVVLNSPKFPGEAGRRNPESIHAQFLALPVELRISILTRIYEFHCYLESMGIIAEDFYDGCILYHFESKRVWICDIDCYHRGAFILDRERTYGSGRFMAPEEYARGSTIDARTTVYNLGRAAIVLLAHGNDEQSGWIGNRELYEVAAKATNSRPDGRFSTVAEFLRAWMDAVTA